MIIYIAMNTIKAGALQYNSLLHMSHLTKSALFIQQNAAWIALIWMQSATKCHIWTFWVLMQNYRKSTLATPQQFSS